MSDVEDITRALAETPALRCCSTCEARTTAQRDALLDQMLEAMEAGRGDATVP